MMQKATRCRLLLVLCVGLALTTGHSALAADPRLDAGDFVNLATSPTWSFELDGVPPGQRYVFTITGPGHGPITGNGEVAAAPHRHPVDLSVFRKGEIRVEVTLTDANEEIVGALTDTVFRDPAYPAGYL